MTPEQVLRELRDRLIRESKNGTGALTRDELIDHVEYVLHEADGGSVQEERVRRAGMVCVQNQTLCTVECRCGAKALVPTTVTDLGRQAEDWGWERVRGVWWCAGCKPKPQPTKQPEHVPPGVALHETVVQCAIAFACAVMSGESIAVSRERLATALMGVGVPMEDARQMASRQRVRVRT
jgi:hypothetical protein